MYTWWKTTRPIHSITEVELLITFTLTSSCQPINQPVRFNLYIFSVINFHHVSLSLLFSALRMRARSIHELYAFHVLCMRCTLYNGLHAVIDYWNIGQAIMSLDCQHFVTLSTSAAEARKQVIGLYRNLVVNQQRANIILLSENCSFGPAEILWLMIRS